MGKIWDFLNIIPLFNLLNKELEFETIYYKQNMNVERNKPNQLVAKTDKWCVSAWTFVYTCACDRE